MNRLKLRIILSSSGVMLICVFICSCLVFAQEQKESQINQSSEIEASVQEHLNRGDTLHKEGRFKEAEAEFKKALEIAQDPQIKQDIEERLSNTRAVGRIVGEANSKWQKAGEIEQHPEREQEIIKSMSQIGKEEYLRIEEQKRQREQQRQLREAQRKLKLEQKQKKLEQIRKQREDKLKQKEETGLVLPNRLPKAKN